MSYVFRTNKKLRGNYTSSSNYHLQDMTLSMKARGLLSMMLSYSDSWKFSKEGLASRCKESIGAVNSALKELQKSGYLEIKKQTRNADGSFSDSEYLIYEMPKSLMSEEELKAVKRFNTEAVSKGYSVPVEEHPVYESKPENPSAENSISENSGQINTPTGDISNKDSYNNNSSITHSVTTKNSGAAEEIDRVINSSLPSTDKYNSIMDLLKRQVGFGYVVGRGKIWENKLNRNLITADEYYSRMQVDDAPKWEQVLTYIADFLFSKSCKPVWVRGNSVDRAIVRQKIKLVDSDMMADLVKKLNTISVSNPRDYSISVLYNY